MSNRIFSAIMMSLLLLGTLALVFNVQLVKASGTIYIRADGSVQGTTYIVTSDNVTYLLTANITATIIVQRDNTVLDGNGYTVQGNHAVVITGAGSGIDLSERSNVTVKNTQITGSSHGIYLADSTSNLILENNMTDNYEGIWVYSSSGNLIFHNNFVNNTYQQADIDTPGPRPNIWDDGYPSGGNYWSDYAVYYPNARALKN